MYSFVPTLWFCSQGAGGAQAATGVLSSKAEDYVNDVRVGSFAISIMLPFLFAL